MIIETVIERSGAVSFLGSQHCSFTGNTMIVEDSTRSKVFFALINEISLRASAERIKRKALIERSRGAH